MGGTDNNFKVMNNSAGKKPKLQKDIKVLWKANFVNKNK